MTDSPLLRIALALEKIALLLEHNRTVFEGVREKKANAGRASAEARRKKYGSSQPSKFPLLPNRLEHTSNTKALVRHGPKGASQAPVVKGTNVALGVYCDAFKKRYGIHPILDGKSLGLMRNLLKAIPLEKLSELIQAYLQMDDPWFKTRCHDVATLSLSIGKVAVALANGTSDPHEKDYWRKVFGDGETDLRNAIEKDEGNLGRKKLSP